MGSCCSINDNRLVHDKNDIQEKILKQAALNGDTNIKVPPLNRVIRLFISSTLRDMKRERNTIIEKLYPELSAYCSQKGYILQIMDLRWGVFKTAMLQHLTGDISLLEVEFAKEQSSGLLCMIAMLSHRYGMKFPPRALEETDYIQLKNVCNPNERALLDKWYELDTNNVPHIRVLRTMANEDTLKIWDEQDSDVIVEIFEKYAERVFTDKVLIERCTRSITELEIIKGIFEAEDPKSMCLVFLRHLSCFQSLNYIKANAKPDNQIVFNNLDANNNSIFYENYEKIDDLKRRLIQFLPKKNIINFNLKIELENDDENNEEEFENYLESFSESFSKNVKSLIEANLNRNETLFFILADYSDLFHHLRFCQEKVKHFVGRSNYINKIKNLLLKEKKNTIVIHGRSGSGKTSLIAKASTDLRNWFPHKKNTTITLVLRFIGTSQDSYNIQSLLSSIIKQLAIKYELRIEYEKMWPIFMLYNYFKTFLLEVSKECKEDEMIIIILDSLDQLSTEYDGRKLEWFPTDLPENIKFIVSTLPEEKYDSFMALKNLISDDDSFLELKELDPFEVEEIIENTLRKNKRKLTQTQLDIIRTTFTVCNIPLYVKMILDQAITWKSFENIDHFLFKNDTVLAVHALLENVELIYGKSFVVTVLRYITLSRHGLYENYLQDILSNDDEVKNFLKDQFRYAALPSRIPQVFLLRLINSLKEYFTTPMYRWYHRMFQDVAYERYCNKQYTKSNERCHSIIVKTFDHERLNTKNPFFINELPYYAVCANDVTTLKLKYLLDLKFMQTKIQTSDIDFLINDYQFAIKKYKDDEALSLITQTLLIAAYKIRVSPSELPGQLYGRLHDFSENIELNNFLKNCLVPPQVSILPNKSFMAQPCKLLSKTIPVHKSSLKTVIVSNNQCFVITCAEDATVKILSSFDFSCKRMFSKRYKSTINLTMSPDDKILYAYCRIAEPNSGKDAIIEAYDLASGKCNFLFEIKPNDLSKFGKISKHRALICSKSMSQLWFVTKDIWLKVDWMTGQLEKICDIPKEFSSQPDDVISAVSVQNRLLCVLDIKSIIISLKVNSDNFKTLDLKDETVMGREILVLPNDKIALSVRRTFKSLYDQSDEMEWHILLCDPTSLTILTRIPVSKALNMWRCSSDNKTIYCRAFNYIYIIDIEEKRTKYILEHSSQMNSNCALNDNTVLSSTWDNKLNIWDLLQLPDFKNKVDLFDTFNYRMIRFLYDDFNTKSRYAIFYNVFDHNFKELLLLYDISEEKVIRKIVLEDYSKNDLKPVMFLSNEYVLIHHLSEDYYFIVDLDEFKIRKTFKCDNIKAIQKLNDKKIVLSIKQEWWSFSSTLVLFDCDTFESENLISNLGNIDLYSINKNKFLYRLTETGKFHVFEFETRKSWITTIEMQIDKIYSSENGSFLAVTTNDNNMTKIYVYLINSSKKAFIKHYEIPQIPNILCVKFITDSYLIYQCKRDYDRFTYICDLRVKLEYNWFKDDDKFGNSDNFDCLSNEDSCYIWYQRYQVNRRNHVKTDITVFHKNDISKPLATLDADCRLKINQMALVDDGNALIVKELDKLSFVTFSVRSEASHPNELNIKFDPKIYDIKTDDIIFKKESKQVKDGLFMNQKLLIGLTKNIGDF